MDNENEAHVEYFDKKSPNKQFAATADHLTIMFT